MLTCPICWKEFKPIRANQKYCSAECLKIARKEIRNALKEIACKNCGKIFMWKFWKFCSDKCKKEYNSKEIIKICIICWNEFLATNPRTKYCSDKCARKYNDTIRQIKRKCDYCWKTFIGNRCTDYCSDECRRKGRTEKMIKTSRKKRNCDWVSQDPSVMEKIENTTLKNHGVKHYVETQECHDKINNDSSVERKFQKKLDGLWIPWTKQLKLSDNVWTLFYDIKVGNTLIELNPGSTHNTLWNAAWGEPKDKEYHRRKTNLAKVNGYRCINVFDRDDWDKIIWLLWRDNKTIYARKCTLREINYDEAHIFLEKNHLQNDTVKNKNNIYIWLYFQWELVEMMSFWKPRYSKWYKYEILRLCTAIWYRVIWWASKIYKYFLKLANPESVISYCDIWKFDWKVYEQLWFKLEKEFLWLHREFMKAKKIWCPFHLTNKLVEEVSFDKLLWKYFWTFGKGTDNSELLIQHWYVPIYDAGQRKYIRHKEKEEK